MAAGTIAEVVASLVRLPMEVSKLRLQLGVYSSSWHAARELFLRPQHIYGNFVPQTLAHDSVYSACAWLIFETGRQWLFVRRGEAELPASENLALGTLTGALSALVTTPLDVLKTRVVGQVSDGPTGLTSLRTAAKELLREEGPWAFWRGASLRVAHLAPSHGLYMLLYEVAKRQISFARASEAR
uniref:Mitochondrial carrier protein n=1 Tax=Pyrodinium bahamense TaxID=73915 RepID=A0A7S0FZG0_9DINO